MALPPGPVYLLQLIPYFLIPSGTTWAILRLLQSTTFASTFLSSSTPALALPTWLTILLITFSRLFLTVFQRYYQRYQDRKAAEREGAAIVPHVQEKRPAFGGFSLMKALITDMKTGYPGELSRQWAEEYGQTYQVRFPSDNMIITFEPDYIKAILATQFDAFDKGAAFTSVFRSLLGDGIFNVDGEMWKFHRTMTRPFFTKERISDFENFEVHADDALRRAKERLADGYALDFQDLVSRFTLDSATQFLLGRDIQSLDAGLPYPASASHLNTVQFLNHPSNQFANAFLSAQILATFRNGLGPHWPLGEFWKDGIKVHKEELNKVTGPLFEKAVEEMREEERNGEKEKDREHTTLLEHLVRQTQDKTLVMDELLNLLVAGRDTTASLLTFCFYMLTQHPHIARRLREEVLEKVGPTQAPTYATLRELKFLRAFINETLRLYPVVPFDSRTSNKETVWQSKVPGSKPFYIPANTRVVYGIIYLHRRTDLWGPDALEFDPDRFLDERLHKYLTPNPYIFCPFNAGPRICLGQQFAYQEASFFLVRLLQQFQNFRLAPEAQPADSLPPASWADGPFWKAREKIFPATYLTMSVKGGLWVTMDPIVG